MLRIGITGGIGTGKTTVCKIFEHLGIEVYYADAQTKALYLQNTDLKEKLVTNFGISILDSSGNVDLIKLKSIFFESEENKKKIDHIVHPFVIQDYENWCTDRENQAYTLKEAAILFESGSYKTVHKIVGVASPLALRITRIQQRNHWTAAEIQARMDMQMNQEELLQKCDFVIYNDEEHSLLQQVIQLDKIFKVSSK